MGVYCSRHSLLYGAFTCGDVDERPSERGAPASTGEDQATSTPRTVAPSTPLALAIAVLRAFFAALTLVTVVHQLSVGLGRPGFSAANFFSYFTILSNVFAAAVLTVGAARPTPRDPRWGYVRGAAALFMVVTGIVYALLLSDVAVGLTATWVNAVLHQVMPVVMLADWLLVPPRTRVRPVRALVWLAFPLAYFAYSLVRGPLVDWYPYPFLDPRDDGYGPVAVTAVVLAVVMAGLALLIAWLGDRLGRRRAAPRAGDSG